MKNRISASEMGKLDAPLTELCDGSRGLAPNGRIPVLVKCDKDSLGRITATVNDLGGVVRHQLNLVGALATWLPLSAVAIIANEQSVQHLELEQSFTIA
jgi:hypothetical protein